MCKKNTENMNPRVLKPNNDKSMLLSKSAICDTKKSGLIKKQEVSEVLCSFYLLEVNFCLKCI